MPVILVLVTSTALKTQVYHCPSLEEVIVIFYYGTNC